MGLKSDPHTEIFKDAGWHSRGDLPHFDGAALPQFISYHLADSIPAKVIERWKEELKHLEYEQERILLQRRIEKYLDCGFGELLLKDKRVAGMVQDSLLHFDGSRYRVFAWVVMPNHLHSLRTRFENYELKDILHSIKSYTEANKLLHRTGQFWIEDYFDRYIRDENHFHDTVDYIEMNPVRAGLCDKPNDWPFSSAWFKKLKTG